MRSLTWADVWACRIERHRLRERSPGDRIVEVVGAVCGIHAQMMPAAELSIGARVAGITRQDVRAELWEKRRLVKTNGIRGTIHLFPADELPLWMAAMRGRSEVGEEKRLAQMGLEPGQVQAIVQAVGEALDGRRLTLKQLGGEIAALAGAWANEESAPAWGGRWPRWKMALGSAAFAGKLCFGPNVGNEVTYVRPDQWLGSWSEVDPGHAIGEVYRRYLRAYGPATPRDFGQWFNVTPTLARRVHAALDDELVEVDVEGHRCFLLADGEERWPAARDTVRLLPHFDCYLIGSTHESSLSRLPGRTGYCLAEESGTCPC